MDGRACKIVIKEPERAAGRITRKQALGKCEICVFFLLLLGYKCSVLLEIVKVILCVARLRVRARVRCAFVCLCVL